MVFVAAKPAIRQEYSGLADTRSEPISSRHQGADHRKRPRCSRRLDEHQIQDALHEHGARRQDLHVTRAKQTDRERDSLASGCVKPVSKLVYPPHRIANHSSACLPASATTPPLDMSKARCQSKRKLASDQGTEIYAVAGNNDG